MTLEHALDSILDQVTQRIGRPDATTADLGILAKALLDVALANSVMKLAGLTTAKQEPAKPLCKKAPPFSAYTRLMRMMRAPSVLVYMSDNQLPLADAYGWWTIALLVSMLLDVEPPPRMPGMSDAQHDASVKVAQQLFYELIEPR